MFIIKKIKSLWIIGDLIVEIVEVTIYKNKCKIIMKTNLNN